MMTKAKWVPPNPMRIVGRGLGWAGKPAPRDGATSYGIEMRPQISASEHPCCALPAKGHAAAALPSRVMNSRRLIFALIRSPRRRARAASAALRSINDEARTYSTARWAYRLPWPLETTRPTYPRATQVYIHCERSLQRALAGDVLYDVARGIDPAEHRKAQREKAERAKADTSRSPDLPSRGSNEPPRAGHAHALIERQQLNGRPSRLKDARFQGRG